MSSRIYGFRIKQRQSERAPHFFVGISSARELLEFSDIRRLQDQEGGMQRGYSKSRAKNIGKFFAEDERNVSPTAVTLALPPATSTFAQEKSINSNVSLGTLEVLSPGHKPATIVDGQHRILGISDLEEAVPLIAVLLLDVDNTEQAFQFVVINNKASKVAADLVKALIADFDETELLRRLKGAARMSIAEGAIRNIKLADDLEDSPFYQMIDWDRRRGEGVRAIKPRAIEHAVRAVLRRLAPTVQDEDTGFEFFLAIWNGAREEYPELWRSPEECRLFENAGFKAFTEYVTEELCTLAEWGRVDLTDMEGVSGDAKFVASKISVEFWRSKWALKGLDTSTGLELVKEDLQAIRKMGLSEAVEEGALNLLLPGVVEE